MCHVESSLISHMMTLRNAADFFGVGILAFALELALRLEYCGDVVDGALMELFEGCTRKALAAGVVRGIGHENPGYLRLSTEKQE